MKQRIQSFGKNVTEVLPGRASRVFEWIVDKLCGLDT